MERSAYFRADGEMAARMRAFDWASTRLGPPSDWPRSLHTLVDVMLGSRQPMFLTWGPERILLYNDSYAPILGQRNSDALGRGFEEVWFDIMEKVKPILDRAYAGEPTHMDDIALLMHRNGFPEQAHFSFSYTPVHDEIGSVAGMFCACTETTDQVKVKAAMVAEKERLEQLFQQAPGLMCMVRGPDHVFEYVNTAYRKLIGDQRDVVGKSVRDAMPELENQGFLELLDSVYTSGEAFSASQMPVGIRREPDSPIEKRFLDFIYQPVRDGAGAVTGIFVEGYDVTERVEAQDRQQLLLREMNHRVKNLFSVAIGMVGITARSTRTKQEMTQALQGRLGALARASAISQFDPASGEMGGNAMLRALVGEIMEPYGTAGSLEGPARVRIEGSDLAVAGDAITSLALALYELATNAVKHGSLSVPDGAIRIAWEIDGEALDFSWFETGGPPMESAPELRGFGTGLVRRSIEGQLNGSVNWRWKREGLNFHARIPMSGLALPK